MAIDTIHTRPGRDDEESAGIVDVSGMPTAQVERFAAGEDVHFERRGGRTYLVPAN